jgi:hypothetical protein
MATNWNAVKKLNQAKKEKQQALAQAYEELGGSNPAYKPIQTNNVLANPQRMTATIPQLEKAVINAYEGNEVNEAGKGVSRPTRIRRPNGTSNNVLQSLEAPTLGLLTAHKTSPVKREDYSGARQDYASLYNDILDSQLERKLTQANVQIPDIVMQETLMGNKNNMFGRLTPELEAAGITQDELTRYIESQARAQKEANAVKLAQSHPVSSTGMAIVSNPIESAIGNIQQVSDRLQGKPLQTSYSPSSIIRNTVSEGIDSKGGKIAYAAANTVGDMGMALLLGKILGGGNPQAISYITRGVQSAEKSNETMNSAIERGLTPNQVISEGAGSMLSTFVTEALPIERIVGGSSNIVGSLLAEGGQEALEDIVDTLFDQAITLNGGNVEKSELGQSYNEYLNMGLSEEDAKAQVLSDYWDQLKLDAALGALTGGSMQAGTNVLSGRNAVTGNLTQRNQNQILESLNAEEVTPNNYNQFSQTIDNLKENVPEMSKKLDSLRNDVSNQIMSDIKTAAETVLDSGDVNAYNEFVQNVEQIKAQIPALESDINNVLTDTTNEFMTLASESVIPSVENGNVDISAVQNNANAEVNSEIANNPTQAEVKPERRLSRNEVAQVINTANSVKENLALFEGDIPRGFEAQIDNAINAITNTSGEAQVQAVSELNDVINNINQQMAGEQVGASARNLNRDGFNAMRNVTNGRQIRVTPEMLRNVNLKTVTELNNLTNTGTNNRIRFYAENTKNDSAVSLDSIWNEMVEQSGNALPAVSEGDQLQALIDYINEYKSKKGDKVMTTSWENLPTNAPSGLVADWQTRTNDILDSAEDGSLPEEAYAQYMDGIFEAYENAKTPEAKDALLKMYWDAYTAKHSMPESSIELDEDVKNIQTEEEAQESLSDATKKLANAMPMNLGLFGNPDVEEEAEIPSIDNRKFHSGKFKTSKYATNTFPNSDIMTKEEMDQAILDEMKQYETVTHEGTYNKAAKNLKENGYRNELKELMTTNREWDAVDMDEAMLCLVKASRDSRGMINRGEKPETAWKKPAEIFLKIREKATIGGQAIEALKKWSANTPEGKLGQAMAFAKEAQAGNAKNNPMNELKGYKRGVEEVFTPEFAAEFLEKAHSLDGQEVTPDQIERLNSELAHMVQRQIKPTFREKFTSLWMDNLLASFRTLFTRNVGGNLGKFALDQTLVKAISGPIDTLVSNITGDRTTTGFTKEGFGIALQGLREGAFKTSRDYWAATTDPEKVKTLGDILKNIDLFADANVSNRAGSENNFAESLKNNRTVFNTKAFKLYDKVIKFGLAFSDVPFYNAVYKQTLYELNVLKDSGKLPDVDDGRFEIWSKAYATAAGLEAIYQDNTKLAQGAMRIKQGIADMSEGYLGIDMLSNTSMPFVRTPMNVIKTNLEFNPLGIIKNAIQTIKEVTDVYTDEKTGKKVNSFNQSRFVKETSRNLVGLLFFAAGLAMKNAGLLTGGYSKNEKEKEAQKQAGMQEYAFVNPLNGNQYSIDWIPALGSPFISAAAFMDAYEKPDQTLLQAVASGAKEGAASMFEQSALQGLQRLTGATSYNSDSIVDNAIQTVANTASSAIMPSIVRQIAAATDPYKRDTYSGGKYEDILANAINGIPFLRQQLLNPRIGLNGQPIEQNAGRSTFQKWMDNLVSPAMVTVPNANQDPVRDEAMRLFEETRSYDAFQPQTGMDYLETNSHVPTQDEYTQFLSEANSAMNDTAQQMIDNDYYQNLSADSQGKALKKVYDAIRQAVRCDILGDNVDDLETAARIYATEGEEALINYVLTGTYLNQMGINNNQTTQSYVQQQLQSGDIESLNQSMEVAQDLASAGFNENLTFKYNHAVQYIPSLTPAEFGQTWNDMNTNGNSSVSQDEILAYLNQNPTSWSESDVNMYWQAYLQDPTYQPYFNEEEGIWKKHKP